MLDGAKLVTAGGVSVEVVAEVAEDDLGFGTALQIFNAFEPSPRYPFISYNADFCSSSTPKRTKPYPFENPDESKMTFAVFIELYLFENTLYKLQRNKRNFRFA